MSFSRLDAKLLPWFAATAALSCVLPTTSFRSVSRRIAGLVATPEDDKILNNMRAVLGERIDDSALREARLVNRAAHIEQDLQTLRQYPFPSYAPRPQLLGREHLDAALERGKGAIVWISKFRYPAMTSIALTRAGYGVHHLTHPSHGYGTNTRYGIRFLNPIVTKIEDRSLASRVTLSPEGPQAALETLRQRLAENAVVSFRAAGSGKRVVEVPFLSGRLRTATGAAKLALDSGAALLPVFLERRPDGAFLVHVEPAIEPGEEVGEDARTASPVVMGMIRDYAKRLEPHVVRTPGLWSGWRQEAGPDHHGVGDKLCVVPGYSLDR